MRNYLFRILILILLFTLSSNAQIEHFESDVKTIKKPWTHLDFYNDPMNFQFAIVSDNTGGSRKGVFAKAVEKLNLLMPEFVMSVGDLIQGYTEDTAQINTEWNEFNEILNDLKPPFFYLPGNHDITNLVMQKEWEKRYGKRYYHFIYKNTLFITLDSNDDDDYSISQEQKNFVLNTLKENSEVRWTFIFMHHPIWKYDTDNRFETIEAELDKRKHTVFAGHEHRYHHIERNEHNYYVLGTTGGGSALRGHRFGEFDHITWLTVTNDGPVFANLVLDKIHEHDISNDETKEMAKSMLNNSSFEHVLLTNSGNKFSDGTLYMHFKNSTDYGMQINTHFYHNHDVFIDNAELEFDLHAKSDTTVEISLKSINYENYEDLDLLQFDWSFTYNDQQYSDFSLEGKYSLPIKPMVKSNYISPNILEFINSTSVNISSPFENLTIKYTTNGLNPTIHSDNYKSPILIKNSVQLRFALFNDKYQSVALAPKDYKKIEMIHSEKVSNISEGLSYNYYEGEWEILPIFEYLTPIKSGIAHDFLVSDIADRKDNFGLVYRGFINIPEDNFYIFRMKADDASRLYIHDKLLVDDSKDDDFGAIYLQKGYHPLRIDFMEQKGSERLRMYYKNKEEDEWKFMYFDMFYTN
jgi:hypothetical protein